MSFFESEVGITSTPVIFTIPVVAEGRVYVLASRELDVYGLLNSRKPAMRQ
jgi:hypothetical protein